MKRTSIIGLLFIFLLINNVFTASGQERRNRSDRQDRENTEGSGRRQNRGSAGFPSKLYTEKTGAFSLQIPEDWETLDMGLKYLMLMGPVDNIGAPNMNFGDTEYFGTISDYIDVVVSGLSIYYTNVQILEQRNFRTNSGLRGRFITIQGRLGEVPVRQKIYIFFNTAGTAVMQITGTALQTHGEKYDSVFDECVRTFVWNHGVAREGT